MKKTPVLHPYFFAAYAVLGVYAQSPQELPVGWVIRPLIVLLGVTWLIYFTLRKWIGNDQHAGLISSLFLAWLFIGHLRNVLVGTYSFTPSLTQDLLLLSVWGLLLTFLGSKWLWIRIKIPEMVTNFLNITSWIVILLPTYFAVVFASQAIQQVSVTESNGPLITPVTLSSTKALLPDIYVIILDAYGRDDYLNEVFGYNNRGFTDFLRARGFYIAEHSQPNYPQTQLSVSSLFNFQYLNSWAKGLEKTNNRSPITDTIRHSEVRRALEEIGYQTVNIPNSTLISDINDSGIYLPMTTVFLNHFEGLLVATTVLDIFIRAWDWDLPAPSYDMHRRTIQYQFDTLKTIPSIPGPKLVFVHILAPHPPFVLDAEGNSVEPTTPYTLADGEGFPGTVDEYQLGYTQEISFVNTQLMIIVDTLLRASKQPPIIILQGDHGPGSRFGMLQLATEICLWERYSILNAYHFPEQKYEGLYPSITPVNSFRVIFNTFFGTDLPMLEDKSYYASYGSPYIFEDITGQIQPACTTP